jgi:hypothetical protein
MRCGKCKNVDVDAVHVQTCYLEAKSPRPSDHVASAASEDDESDLRVTEADADFAVSHQFFQRASTTRGMGPVEFSEVYGDHIGPLYGAGMDADGMTPYLRELEDEYGFEGMLYRWRDGNDEG